jgi:hypothetical protein
MSFNIDYTVDTIIKEIIDEIGTELGEEVTYDMVRTVIEQQSKSTVEGMKQGHTIIWKYFGTFVASKKRVDALNNRYRILGLRPNLEDRGFYRVSFDASGNEKENKFESNVPSDYDTREERGHKKKDIFPVKE